MTGSKAAVGDLAAWLTRIWDEEERLAKRAGDWLTAPEIDNYCHLTVPSAWMLARIAADRKILELHRGPHDCRGFKTGSHPAGWLSAGSPSGRWVYVSTERYDNEPCPTKRLLAEPYAEREGFRSEWSVERQGVEW